MQLGVRHAVCAASIDESPLDGESAPAYVERLARAKAAAVRIGTLPTLAADTIVVVDGELLGKPVDDQDAACMLRRLSGRAHRVLTAVAVTDGQRLLIRRTETTVWFQPLDATLISRYIATGESADKAGAYGIQGMGAALVAKIDGSYSGVVGLPLAETAELLAAFGVTFWRDDCGLDGQS